MGKPTEDSEFYRALFKKFDKGLISSLDHFSKTINVSLHRVEKRLKKCEDYVYDEVNKYRKSCESDLALAENLVNKELRSKIMMSQWTNKFLAATKEIDLDPITFGISRFSLNVCLTFRDVNPMYMLEISLHRHLVTYISQRSELAIGPSLMALVHISLYPQLKGEIVGVGALPSVLKLMVHSKSKVILAQCVKLCASLSLENANKTLMAQSGCLHALFDLILGAHVDVDRHVQYGALCGIVNTIYKNDANRMLAVELNGIKPILTTLRTSSHENILVQGIQALANIAFGNPYTANCILVGGGGETLMDMLSGSDVLRQPVIVYSILATFSNICNSEVNQSHVGSINGIIECILRICDNAREVYLVTEAANVLLALCWNNIINKARIANKGGCTAVVKRLIRHSTAEGPEQVACTEKLCLALSSILLYTSNHERMLVIGGLQEVVRIGKVVTDPILLRALSKIIVTMVPTPDELLRLHKDGNKYVIETCNALPVLKKAKFRGFAHMPIPPDWLESAIIVLSSNDLELRSIQPWEKVEFVDKLEFCKEFQTEIYPDSEVGEVKEFRGLLFSIY